MERLSRLGEILSSLRGLSGLSIPEVAAGLGLSEAEVRGAERGDVAEPLLDALAAYYGLEPERLREGVVDGVALPDHAPAAVFLFHGATTCFDVRDLVVVERAMRAARAFTALTQAGREGIGVRAGFRARPPSGPLPRDAARQGYELAREVRAVLALPAEPLGDIRAFLEDALGVAVRVERLVSSELRAIAALDAARAAATAVLDADDAQRAQNPLLARVYLAHELCHLLFDPVRPGRVQIAADLLGSASEGPGVGAPSVAALMEARARGFAAELLIPRRGVESALGSPARERSASRALEMLEETFDRFRTPKEIAVRHLVNLGYVERMLSIELLGAHSSGRPEDTTTLPEAGEPPRGLEDQLRSRPEMLPDEVPEFVVAARDCAREDAGAAAAALLDEAYEHAARARPLAATDMLVAHLDGLLSAGDVERAASVLDALNPTRLPPEALTGVLVVTAAAREVLGQARALLVTRVTEALRDHWKIGGPRLARIEARLR